MSRLEFRGKTAARLGDDFQRPRDGIERSPIALELLERESGDKFTNELPILSNSLAPGELFQKA
jgi:hypothetical protein